MNWYALDSEYLKTGNYYIDFVLIYTFKHIGKNVYSNVKTLSLGVFSRFLRTPTRGSSNAISQYFLQMHA